jgi:hypothetical protein
MNTSRIVNRLGVNSLFHWRHRGRTAFDVTDQKRYKQEMSLSNGRANQIGYNSGSYALRP